MLLKQNRKMQGKNDDLNILKLILTYKRQTQRVPWDLKKGMFFILGEVGK